MPLKEGFIHVDIPELRKDVFVLVVAMIGFLAGAMGRLDAGRKK